MIQLYDILIAGAGPMGNYLAFKMANKGLKVAVFEEHSEIGKPVHCTGIIGAQSFQKFHVPSNSIIKELPYFKVYAPSGHYIYFPHTIKAYIVHRDKFDRDIADMAESKGAEYFLDSRVVKIENHKDHARIIVDKGDKQIKFDGKLCVIATGAMSNLPYESGITKPKFFYKTAHTELEVSNLEGAEIFTGEKYAPGSFAYVVSTYGKIAKAGLITRVKAKNCLENLLQHRLLKNRIEGQLDIVKYRRVPMGIPKNTVINRVLALGDAAGQIKTTTAGGVYLGLVCTEILAATLIKACEKKDFNLNKVKEYDYLWKKQIGSELHAGLLVRAFFEKVEDKYISKIFQLASTDNIKAVVEKKGNYDHHRELIISLMKEPEIRKLVFEMIRKNLPQKRFFNYLVTYIDTLSNINIFAKR